MKKAILLLCIVALSGCGYSSRGNEMVGQVKKVTHQTPLVCGDRDEADISLGVVLGGVGSMSHEDKVVYVGDSYLVETLKAASEAGQLVKVTYDTRRMTLCNPQEQVTKVEVLQ